MNIVFIVKKKTENDYLCMCTFYWTVLLWNF